MKTLELPAILERYRASIDQSVQRLLDGKPDGLYGMLRYHFGWMDASGRPAPHALGKALRPTLCLLACEAVGGTWERALPAAAALELIHNFSLIHDDIQDGDQLRHHRPTVWAIWGQPQAINAGDAAFALSGIALEQLREQDFPAEITLTVWQLLNTATLRLVEGQYLDLAFEHRPDMSVDEYLAMIARKTGALIEAAMQIGTLLGAGARATPFGGQPLREPGSRTLGSFAASQAATGNETGRTRGGHAPAAGGPADQAMIDHLRRFGRALGLAFQIGDDLLGIWGQAAETGKPVAADLRRRKKSLPIVYAMQYSSHKERALLTELYARHQGLLNDAEVERALAVLERTGAQEQTHDMLADYCSKALLELEQAKLPAWAHTEFATVARFLAQRRV
jgi:geranylgeranyl diphosphate synthase, type I